MSVNMNGKVALVTGASRGLGKCIVEKFLRAGAAVVFIDLFEDAGKAVEQELSTLGKVEFLKVDITDEEAVKGLIRHIAEKYGKLDCLVNNASRVITTQHRMHEYDMDMVRKMVAVNVCGTFLCMKYAIERMLVQPGKGVIVNVSSASTEYVASGLSIYSATKSAINNLTQAGALEYGPEGIRINAVLPGAMETEAMKEFRENDPENYQKAVADVPLRRIVDPAEVADSIVWLCSDEAAYITGHKMIVDGGCSL